MLLKPAPRIQAVVARRPSKASLAGTDFLGNFNNKYLWAQRASRWQAHINILKNTKRDMIWDVFDWMTTPPILCVVAGRVPTTLGIEEPNRNCDRFEPANKET